MCLKHTQYKQMIINKYSLSCHTTNTAFSVQKSSDRKNKYGFYAKLALIKKFILVHFINECLYKRGLYSQGGISSQVTINKSLTVSDRRKFNKRDCMDYPSEILQFQVASEFIYHWNDVPLNLHTDCQVLFELQTITYDEKNISFKTNYLIIMKLIFKTHYVG